MITKNCKYTGRSAPLQVAEKGNDAVPRDQNIPLISSEDQPVIAELSRLLREVARRRLDSDTTFEQRQRARMDVMADVMWTAEHSDLENLTTDEPMITVDGHPYRRLSQPSSKPYFGLWGTHLIEEPLYRDATLRAGPTIKPLELRVGVISSAVLPDAARILGHLMAHQTSREAVVTLCTMGLRPPSRAFVERHLSEMAVSVVDRLAELEAAARTIEASHDLPVAAISAGLDRMAVRMSEPSTQQRVTPPARKKPYKRAPPPPRVLNWRMAWVGSVTLYDAGGEPIRTIRFGTGASTPRQDVIDLVHAEVQALLDRYPGVPVVCVQDGAKDLQPFADDLKSLCAAKSPFYQCLDFHHAIAYLDAVVKECEPDGDPNNMRDHYRRCLLNDKHASYQLVAELRRRKVTFEDDEVPDTLKRTLSYLTPRRRFMRYAALRALNLPIGSGATESTCALMQLRVKRPGMSWDASGLNGILALRSLVLAERWTLAWPVFAANSRQEVKAA